MTTSSDSPEFAAAIDRGLAAHRERRLDDAISAYQQALRLQPLDAEAQSLCGLAQLHAGRLEVAAPHLLRAVDLEPTQAGFRLNLVEALEAAGNLDRAMKELRIVTGLEPGNARGWEKTGDIAARQGDGIAAGQAWQRAYQLDPSSRSLALKLGQWMIATGDHDGALELLRTLGEDPTMVAPVYALRTEIAATRRDWPAMDSLLREWLAKQPGSLDAQRMVARAAFERGRHRDALAAFSKVIAAAPATAADLAAFGNLCLHALEFDEADRALAAAASLDPNLASMLASRALSAMYRGQFDTALRDARRCLAADPSYVAAYTIISRLLHGVLDPSEMDAVQRIATDERAHADRRIPAAFASAHAQDAAGHYDAAFAAYAAAHRLSLDRDLQEQRRFDAVALRERNRILRSQPATAARATAAATRPDSQREPRPVFIVGMPRSGTTLVEAVLGAHSRVFAGGERPAMQQVLRAWLDTRTGGSGGNDGTALAAEQLDAWRAAWRADLPDLGAADIVTDKHPLNFECAGLIAALWPEAVILNLRRNPLETCLSVYRQEFNKHWSFAHRLEDIGEYYLHYASLAHHWEQTLPGRFVTIQYEELVSQFEAGARHLLGVCGLEFEPACLQFQCTPRPIATFSTVQTREPVRNRNGRAVHYARQLAPLAQQLTAAGIDLQTGVLR